MLKISFMCYNNCMDDKKKLFYREFVNRENDFVRAPLVPETEFFSAIKTGNVKKVKELCREPLDEKNGLGVLSTNPLRNLKYHFVITAAMIARSCIEGGMEFSRAYSMSDVYIMEADIMTDVKEISSLHKKMCLEYTSEMKRISQKRIYSKYVNACLNFIYENLHDKITAKKLAEVSGLSESYILRLFHKETEKTVQEYVLAKKIETSKNMLRYTKCSLSDIALTLGFPSQSYWTQAFRKLEGTTPAKYRKFNL